MLNIYILIMILIYDTTTLRYQWCQWNLARQELHAVQMHQFCLHVTSHDTGSLYSYQLINQSVSSIQAAWPMKTIEKQTDRNRQQHKHNR